MTTNSEILTSFPDLKSFSPSSINKWGGDYGDEGLWVLSYLYGVRFTGSPASIRGQVIEDSFLKILMKKDGGIDSLKDLTNKIFSERAEKELLDKYSKEEIAKEQQTIDGFIEQSYESISDLGLSLPSSVISPTQIRVEGDISQDIPLKAAGYIDFDFGDFALDLKTTHRVPSQSIKQDHKKQISFYATARKDKSAKILYLSSKKYRMFSMTEREIDAAFNEFKRSADNLWHRLKVSHIMSKINNSDPRVEMSKLSYANTTSYAWDDEMLDFAAKNKLFGVKHSNHKQFKEEQKEFYL